MKQHDGTVDSDAIGQLVLRRPDGTDDRWWDQVTRLFTSSAVEVTDAEITVTRHRAPAVAGILTRAPASAARWRWQRAARQIVDAQVAYQAALDRVANTTIEDQAVWPDDVDLAGAGFTRILRPEQRDAYARLVFGNGGANFGVPGSGKTTITYAVYTALKARSDVHGMLVVAPPSAFEAWEVEAAECFAPNACPHVRIRPASIGGSDEIVVFNYEKLSDPRTRAQLSRWARNRRILVVFDEAHRAKAGYESQRGAASADLAVAADRRMVLTGTPMPNRPEDLVAVMDLVWPGNGDRLVDGSLSNRRDRTFVRITKDQLDLPPLNTRIVPVELDPAHRALYDAMTDRVAAWATGPTATAAEAGKAILRLISAATNPAAVFTPEEPWSLPPDHLPWDLQALVDDPARHIRPAKIVAAAAMVADNRERGRKTLVWSNFVGNVAAVAAALEQHHPAVITGSTPVDDPRASTDRVRQLDRFRNNDDCWALVATPQTLGEGVSLHHACIDQIHVDRGYAAGTWLQSIDRTHRLGMSATADPTCTVLQAAGTIDERISAVLGGKVSAMAARLNDPTLQTVADPMIVPEAITAVVLGDVDALRELVAAIR